MGCEAITAANQTLVESLEKPSYISSDGLVVSQRSVSDIIKTINYVSSGCAGTNSRRGIRFNRLVPDGTVNSCRASRSFNRI